MTEKSVLELVLVLLFKPKNEVIIMTSQRSIIIFNHAISSEATKKCYLNELKRFKEFYKIKDYDSLTTMEPKEL